MQKLKPGGGVHHGYEFQIWYGVNLAIEWISQSKIKDKNEPPWLREEIGVKKYGIFDDIQEYRNGIYYFYQAKSTKMILGNPVDLDELLDSEGDLSIKKMYDSYSKIKSEYEDLPFYLTIITDRGYEKNIKNFLQNNTGQFEDSFIRNTCKMEKKKIRNKFLELCDNSDIEDFLERISFLKTDSL